MKNSHLTIGFIILTFIGCINQGQESSNFNEGSISNGQIDPITAETPIKFPAPIDIKIVDQTNGLDYTSGGGPADGYLCDSDTFGFYGSYNLIDRRVQSNDPKDVLIGSITIYHPASDMSNWTSSDTLQEFRKIHLKSDILSVWDSIHVGMSEAKLKQFLEDHFHYKKGVFIFCELDPYSTSFNINNGKVEELTVELKCN